MSMHEDRARYVASGDTAIHDKWDADVFIKNMRAFCDRLEKRQKAGEKVEPRMWFGRRENGMRSTWFYIAGLDDASERSGDGEVSTRSHGDCPPDECFDDSHPCPPLC